MNKKSSSRKILILTFFTLVMSGIVVGCTQNTLNADEIVNNAVAAMSKVNTYKYDLDMKTDFYRYDVNKNETGGDNIIGKDVTKVSGIFD